MSIRAALGRSGHCWVRCVVVLFFFFTFFFPGPLTFFFLFFPSSSFASASALFSPPPLSLSPALVRPSARSARLEKFPPRPHTAVLPVQLASIAIQRRSHVRPALSERTAASLEQSHPVLAVPSASTDRIQLDLAWRASQDKRRLTLGRPRARIALQASARHPTRRPGALAHRSASTVIVVSIKIMPIVLAHRLRTLASTVKRESFKIRRSRTHVKTVQKVSSNQCQVTVRCRARAVPLSFLKVKNIKTRRARRTARNVTPESVPIQEAKRARRAKITSSCQRATIAHSARDVQRASLIRLDVQARHRVAVPRVQMDFTRVRTTVL